MKRDEAVSLGYIEGLLSIVVNTALFGVKLWVGIRSDSVAMTADAWHTLSDTLTSIVVIVGFWIVARKPDEKHPLGHGRAEAIASIVIAVLLAVVGVGFFGESLDRLRAREAATFSTVGLVVFLGSAVVKEALAEFSLWAGKRTKAQSLIADGWHHRSDAIASALIVVGMAAARFGGAALWWADGALGIGVAILIVFAAFAIFRESSTVLLGEGPTPEIEEAVRGIVAEATGRPADVHHIHLHAYGTHREITLHFRLPGETTLEECHRLATIAETGIRERLGLVATAHVEPENPARR